MKMNDKLPSIISFVSILNGQPHPWALSFGRRLLLMSVQKSLFRLRGEKATMGTTGLYITVFYISMFIEKRDQLAKFLPLSWCILSLSFIMTYRCKQ